MFRITFQQETVKRLKQELEKAYVRGDKAHRSENRII